MSWKCDVVTDLAPLYHDNEASEASRRLVREHLRSCPTCRGYYKKYRPEKNMDMETEIPFSEDSRKYAVLARRMLIRRVLLFVGCLSYVCATMGIMLLYLLRRDG